MAAADTIPPSRVTMPHALKSSTSSMPPSLSREAKPATVAGNVQFDPEKHLAYREPPKVLTMKELGYRDDLGVSPVGVSEPFPLFTEEAVRQMRAEVLSEDVWSRYKFSSNLAQCQLRGFAPECAPFVYDAWKNPRTLAVVSEIAGIDLVPVMDWEISHINISVKSQEQASAEVEKMDEDDMKPIVDWHTDSYPFVCVTMLSDCTTMVGGETALRKADRSIVKIRGPHMGCAIVLQGRHIEHVALRALGNTQRITMVTSFRPRSPSLRDDTILTTVRPVSDLSELYFQFSEYRLEIIEDRIRKQLKEMRERRSARRSFNTGQMKYFLAEQEKFLAHMNKEMVEDEMVQKGFCDDSHLLSEDLKERSKKRRKE